MDNGVDRQPSEHIRVQGDVHATVRRFDNTTHQGDVILDDGRVMAFDAAAFNASGLRLLRSGQRVRLRVDAAGTVRTVTLATFPAPDEGRGPL